MGSSASGEVGQSMNMKFAIELKYKHMSLVLQISSYLIN